MLSKKLATTIGISCVLALAGIIYFITDANILTIVLTAGFILVTVLVFLLDNMLEDKRRLQDKRERHSADLLAVYQRLADIFVREDYDHSFAFKVPSDYKEYHFNPDVQMRMISENRDPDLVSVTRLEYFDWAIEHLKHRAYGKLETAWIEMERLRNDISEVNLKILSTIEQIVRDKWKAHFGTFVDADLNQDAQGGNYYYVKNIARELISRYERVIEHGAPADFDIDVYGIEKMWTARISNYRLMNSNTREGLPTQQIKLACLEVLNDMVVIDLIKEKYELLNKIVEVRQSFVKEMTHLVKKMNGGYVIEGKCELGY